MLPHTALQQQPISMSCTEDSCVRLDQNDAAIQLSVCARRKRACTCSGTPRRHQAVDAVVESRAHQHATNAASKQRESWKSQGLQHSTAVPAAAGRVCDSSMAPSANTDEQARSAQPAERFSLYGCKRQSLEVASDPSVAAHVHGYWKPQHTGGYSFSKAGGRKATGAIEQLSKLVRELEQQHSAACAHDTPHLHEEASDSTHALLLGQVDAFIRSLQGPSESASTQGNLQWHSQKGSISRCPPEVHSPLPDTRCSGTLACKPQEGSHEQSRKTSSPLRPGEASRLPDGTRCSERGALKPPGSDEERSQKHLASRVPSEAGTQLPDALSSRALACEPQDSLYEHAQGAPMSRRPSAVSRSLPGANLNETLPGRPKAMSRRSSDVSRPLPEADCLEASLGAPAPSAHTPKQRSAQDSTIIARADSTSSSSAWKAAFCEARRESTASQTVYNGDQSGMIRADSEGSIPSTLLTRQQSTHDSTTNDDTDDIRSRQGIANKAQAVEDRRDSTANRQAVGSMKLREQAHVHAAEDSTHGYALPCATPASTRAAHKLCSLEGVSRASLNELEALLREEEQKVSMRSAHGTPSLALHCSRISILAAKIPYVACCSGHAASAMCCPVTHALAIVCMCVCMHLQRDSSLTARYADVQDPCILAGLAYCSDVHMWCAAHAHGAPAAASGTVGQAQAPYST